MRKFMQTVVLACGITLVGVPLGLAADQTGVPQTAPALAPPTYVQVAAVPAPSPNSILLLPFASITPDTQLEWMGRAIQQDLETDVSRASRLIVVTTGNAKPATDVGGALQAGRDARTSLVLFGHYQTVGSNLRVTGQLVDVRTGEALAVLKATGTRDNLFQIEDTLAQQAIGALPRELLVKAVSAPAQEAAPSNPQPTYSTPSQTFVSPSSQSYSGQPAYNYSYDDGYDDAAVYGSLPSYGYSYGYPYYSNGIYLYGGNYPYYHHDYHGGGWNHRVYSSGSSFHGRVGGSSGGGVRVGSSHGGGGHR